ncbi:hypothetical protein M0R45_008612 [Rubus argutus]|uniref:Uncharacterized protein n=1 Tax=Rubus argutus TaxID=59490 RepID=A0AAW1Y275_RUBAR
MVTERFCNGHEDRARGSGLDGARLRGGAAKVVVDLQRAKDGLTVVWMCADGCHGLGLLLWGSSRRGWALVSREGDEVVIEVVFTAEIDGKWRCSVVGWN